MQACSGGASRFTGSLSPALTSFAAKVEPVGRRLAEMLLAATPRENDPPRKAVLKAANAGLDLGAALPGGR